MSQQLRNSFFGIACLFFFLISILQSCSSSRSKLPNSEIQKQFYDSALLKENQKLFADKNPVIVSQIGNLELTSRMATKAEIPEDISKMILFFPAEGSASLALGLIAPPMYASALVVGGIFLIPLGSYLYIHEKNIWETINGVLIKNEITRALNNAIKNHLNMIFTKETMPQGKIEIVIQAFGLVKSISNIEHCLVISASLILYRDNQDPYKENLNITELNKSKDAPPPQCSTLEQFSKEQGKLLRIMMDEYIDVLAVMSVKRVLKKCSR